MTMASGDEKTPPGSPKKPFRGKGGEDAESSGKGEIVRVVREFGGAPNWPMLTKTNYTAWAIKVEAILDAQGLWEAVAPAADAEVDARKNKTARAQLLQALPEDILMQVSTKKTAKEVWESLKTRFVGANRVKTARLATLKGDFDKLCMVDGDALDD